MLKFSGIFIHVTVSRPVVSCRALEFQAFLDAAEIRDLDELLGYKEMMDRASSSTSEGSSRRRQGETSEQRESINEQRKSAELAIAAMKFTYVVAAQVYGAQKKSGSNAAKSIAYLLELYKGLRIAYVDEVDTPAGKQYFSVLVKYDRVAKLEMEVFRVQLPGPLKLGEGKQRIKIMLLSLTEAMLFKL